MAGARIGFLAGPRALMRGCLQLKAAVTRLNTNLISQHGALAALDDDAYLSRAEGAIRANLARLEETLAYPLATAGLPTADVGIGIVNIDRRMKLLFGERFGVVIHVDRDIGTMVTLHLPYHSGEAAAASGAAPMSGDPAAA